LIAPPSKVRHDLKMFRLEASQTRRLLCPSVSCRRRVTSPTSAAQFFVRFDVKNNLPSEHQKATAIKQQPKLSFRTFCVATFFCRFLSQPRFLMSRCRVTTAAPERHGGPCPIRRTTLGLPKIFSKEKGELVTDNVFLNI
jgi:hypothetical protein